ncbi:MAG: CoA transferase [Actinomycetia bacterium]|nr:CoA transferase [Actinomycetes bacterium]MCP4959144.1 CoA transferase [Actinomycetes bacterium]
MTIDPLGGVRVLEIANWAAAPSAGAIMSDLGADVIKVEAPSGDGIRMKMRQAAVPPEENPDHSFQFINRGKRSVALDIGSPAGGEAARRLAATCDVVITNLVPDRRKRFGLDVEDLLGVKHDLVIALFSGYGEEGDEASRLGYDTTAFFARSGIQASIPGPEGPARFRPGMGDHTSGLALFGAIMTGLRVRDLTGEGQVVEATLLRTATWTLAIDLVPAVADGKPVTPRTRHETVSPLIEPFECADAHWLQLTNPDPHTWERFCAAIRRPDLNEPPYDTPQGRFANNSELIDQLIAEFKSRTRIAWGHLLDAGRITWAPINNTVEALNDPQVRATGAFEPIEHPRYGTFDTVASPFRVRTANAGVRGPAPDVGQHNREVLAEAGFSDSEIEVLS